jgi:hypothetical protein
MAKIILTKILKTKILSFDKPIFHHSTIPVFHQRDKFGNPKEIIYFQIVVEIPRRKN